MTRDKLTWGDINKKVQECMLSYYIMDMKNIMTLNKLQIDQLRQTIKLGISNKFFGKHNIMVENNRIFSIDGLLWNNDCKNFYINPELKPKVMRTYIRKKNIASDIENNQKDSIPQFNIKWEKYVEALDKKIICNMQRHYRITINQGVNQTKRLQLVASTTTTDEDNEDSDDTY